MSAKFRNSRARSTSDLLEQGTNDEGQSVLESRYKTFTFKDQRRTEENATTEVSFSEKKKECTTPKSQSFVKKLIASMEKKNKACKADDEFLRYYKKPNPFGHDSTDLFQSQGEFPGFDEEEIDPLIENNSALFDSKGRFTTRNYEIDRQSAPNFPSKNLQQKRNVNVKLEFENCQNEGERNYESLNFDEFDRKFARNFPSKIPPHERNVKLEFENCERERKQNNDSLNFDEFERNKGFTNPKSNCQGKLLNDFDFEEIITGRRAFLKDPSIDRRRLSFQIQDLINLSRSAEKQQQQALSQRNFVEVLKDTGEKSTEGDGKREKKVVRKRSFKNLIGSMIKWKKSERREEPQRFLSCEDFLKETMKLQSRSFEELSRAASLRAAKLQDCDKENSFRESNKNPIVHPVHVNKKDRKMLDEEKKKVTLQNVPESFAIEEDVERLVRPSAIKDITRRLSLLPEKSLRNSRDSSNETRDKLARGRSFNRFKDKTYTRPTISDFGVVLDDDVYSRSMDRKLKKEYTNALTHRM